MRYKLKLSGHKPKHHQMYSEIIQHMTKLKQTLKNTNNINGENSSRES